MYEHRKQKLAPIEVFYKRVLKNILLAILVLFVCLMIGILGYHFTANIPWLDSVHNASMILSGMGPVVEIKNRWRQVVLFFLCLVQRHRIYNEYRHRTGAGYASDVSPVAYSR